MSWTPIGTQSVPFVGVFEGLGNTISNLTVNLPSNTNGVALFGGSAGTIENVGLVNANITGGEYVAGLLGYNEGSVINSYVGSASGGDSMITGTGVATFVGGLVGENDETVRSSHSTAAVAGILNVGGLVGYNATTDSAITLSYATGQVTGNGSSAQSIGGLVGYLFSGSVSQSFATGNVTGSHAQFVGGLVGLMGGSLTPAPSIMNAYATGNVTGNAYVGGLIGQLNGTSGGSVQSTYAAGTVSGNSSFLDGGLIGLIASTGTGTYNVSNNYWNLDVNGAFNNPTAGLGTSSFCCSAGAIAETTAAMQKRSTFVGFDFTNIWGIVPGLTSPFLKNIQTAVSGTVYSDYAGSAVTTGVNVSYLLNGAAASSSVTTSTSASMIGEYAFVLNTTLPSASQLVVYTNGGAAFKENATGSVSGLNIYGGYLAENAASSSLTTVQNNLSAAIGSNSTPLSTSALSNLLLNIGSATFAIDTSPQVTIGSSSTNPTTLVLSTTGTVTQTAAITAANLELVGSGGAYNLNGPTNGSNNVGSLAANFSGGAIAFNDGGNDLSIGSGGVSTGAGAGSVALTDTGAVSQTGAITTGTLSLNGVNASYTLGGSNQVATLTANVSGGSVNFNNGSNSLSIGSGGVSTGANAGSVTLADIGGSVTENGAITTGALSLDGSSYLLTSANQVGTLTGIITGLGLNFNDGANNLSIGSGGINASLLILNDGGAISQTGTITATSLLLSGGGDYTLSGPNSVGTLAAGTGSIAFNNSGSLNIGTVNGTPGVSSSGAIKLISGGSLTINAGASVKSTGGAVFLAANGAFTNNAGSSAVSAGGGATWTIYTQDSSNPTGALPIDNFGGLVGTNYYNDAFDFSLGTLASTPTTSGNLFVYGYAASLTPVLGGLAEKSYDASNTAPIAGLSLAASGLLSVNDSATFTVTSALYATANAGSGISVTASGIGVGSNPNNYTLQFSTATAAIGTIDPKALTASLTGTAEKTYDGTTAATLSSGNYTLTGFVGGQSATVTQTSGAYASADAGGGIVVTAMLGSGDFTAASGTIASNYALPTVASGSVGKIDAKALTASLTGTVEKTYDGTTAATLSSGNYTLTGFVSGQSATVTQTSGAYASVDAGGGIVVTATLGPGDFTAASGAIASNYALPTVASGAVGKIDAKALTIRANEQTTTYGNGNSLTADFTPVGLVNGETVGSVSLATNVTTSSSGNWNAGTWSITPSAAAGGTFNPANYTITYNSGTLTVNPATLVITADDQSKTYGQTANLGATAFAETGLVNSDSISGVTLSSSGAASSAQVGTYTLSPSNAIGSGLSNYTIVYDNAPVGLTVNPATLTIIAGNNTKTYGTTADLSSTSYAVGGLVTANGDSITGVSFSSPGNGASASVGDYALSAAVIGGQGLSNYHITYVNGALTVNPATLTITASNQSKTYGQTANLGATAFAESGLVTANGDSISGVTLSSTGAAATATVAGGPYAIAGSNARGAGLSNYTISYVSGALTVNPATLIYAANAASMIYGGSTPSLTGLVSGFVNGETLGSATTGALTFGTSASATSNVGSYAVTGSGLTADNGNYVFVQATGNSTALTVNPATLTYVADSFVEQTGVRFPTFTGSVTGFVNGQTQASATTGTPSFTSPATLLSPVGTYPINGSGLTANNGDYVLVQAAGDATALTLQQSPSDPPSQFTASTNGATTNATNINLTIPVTNAVSNIGFSGQRGSNDGTFGPPIHIAFAPNAPVNRNKNQANVYPGALPGGQAYTRNHGLDFGLVSQYDVNQYSKFKLPDYDDQAGLSALFTMVARAVARGHSSDYMIDTFWNGADATWPAGKYLKVLEKAVSFTDGLGHPGTPIAGPAFPVVAGQTDLALLLKSGPVMLVGPISQKPAEWVLALGLTADGKNIASADPITGKLVELGYDPTTRMLGGINGIFDPKTKSFSPLAENNAATPNGADGFHILENFTPSGYFVVGFQSAEPRS